MTKVPSNVVRCVADDSPILYPPVTGTPHKCATCGNGLAPEQRPSDGLYWAESYGYLVETEDVVDDRDSDEEVNDLYGALRSIADILGDFMAASGVGSHFTCTEANTIAQALMVADRKREAMTFLEGHAEGDDDEDDEHGDVDDFERYVLELAGKPVPELIDEPKREATDPLKEEAKAALVSTEELLDLMGL
ncbi:hypothetical protein OH733_05290 [Streptomyces griseus]|uniref:hypothetical protein n=1 Tax=Streptomyces griseus TaxID=1911 RepID=UPI0038656612|nr:hypothetical protein OH733_05290 [Streptomyces griseus]WTD71189.1 hypothetical protein OH763_31695 [Streptomyces griseus]